MDLNVQHEGRLWCKSAHLPLTHLVRCHVMLSLIIFRQIQKPLCCTVSIQVCHTLKVSQSARVQGWKAALARPIHHEAFHSWWSQWNNNVKIRKSPSSFPWLVCEIMFHDLIQYDVVPLAVLCHLYSTPCWNWRAPVCYAQYFHRLPFRSPLAMPI